MHLLHNSVAYKMYACTCINITIVAGYYQLNMIANHVGETMLFPSILNYL